jgi:hypothetical protein
MQSIRIILLTAVLLAAGSAPAAAQSDAHALLDRIQATYARINDYRVEITATVDMKGLSVPEMTATVYFKKPDRMHIESDGFAMLPRDAVGFHPDMFEKERYDAVIQGKEKIAGVSCVKLKLLARDDSVRLQRAMLYVDPARDIVLRMDADPGKGASAQAEFTYAKVQGKYWLPSAIDITMDAPMRMRRPGTKGSDEADSKARITLRYSNYVVNKGIPDGLFDR